MLKSYITDADLKRYYPLLTDQLWGSQTSYGLQIDEALARLSTDLWNKEINPSLVMTPLDLVNTSADRDVPLQGTTASAVSSGTYQAGKNETRFVVSTTAGSGSIALEGCNSDPDTESNWQIVTTIDVDGSGGSSEAFPVAYKYYRWKATVVGTSIAFKAYVVETIFDRAIVYATFGIIFADFMRELNDVWDGRRQMANERYESELQAIRYFVDSNSDGVADATPLRTYPDITIGR